MWTLPMTSHNLTGTALKYVMQNDSIRTWHLKQCIFSDYVRNWSSLKAMVINCGGLQTFFLWSSSACLSALRIMFSMSSLLSPPDDWITTVDIHTTNPQSTHRDSWWASKDVEVRYALPTRHRTGNALQKFVKIDKQSLKHKVNRYVLSLRLNECRLPASRNAAGRLFHTTGPATEKALSPFWTGLPL